METREDLIRAKTLELRDAAGRPQDRPEDYRAEAERIVDAEVNAARQRRGPGIDIAPAAEGNSLGDISPAGPGQR